MNALTLQNIETSDEVTTDFGNPFTITVEYVKDSFLFNVVFNGQQLDAYPLPYGTSDIAFSKVTVSGDCSLNFFGFMQPGNSANCG